MNTETSERTYTFKELLELDDATPANTAREDIVTSYDSFWAECTLTDFKDLGEDRGFDIDHIYWSGFAYQGDGVCWVGRVDMDKWMSYYGEANFEPNEYAILYELIVENEAICARYRISHASSRYYHSNTMCIDNTEVWLDSPLTHGIMKGADPQALLDAIGGDALLDRLEETVLQTAKDYADEIYAALEKEYDYVTSDEYISRMCEANDYRFDEDGHLV